jgi:HEPN domain-containing protein
VNLYKNAEETYETARYLFDGKRYRHSIAASCLAVELYLKSRLYLVADGDKYETTHNIIAMYQCLVKRFSAKKNLVPGIKLCRKYFNEARYSDGDEEIYTEDFAREFIGYAADVKDYIDNECIADEDDLMNKFT